MATNSTYPAMSETEGGTPCHPRDVWFRDWYLLAVTALAAVMRLFFLGYKSVWLDEAATYALARLPLRHFVRELWHLEANSAGYYAIVRGWTHLGTSEWMLRFPSAIFGIAAVPAIYLLGRRFFGIGTGRTAALLLAVSPAHVHYSQEARSYALMVFLALLSSLAFCLAVERQSVHRWLIYAIVTAAGAYVHFFLAFVPVAHALSLLALPLPRVRWKPLSPAVALLALLSLPAFVFVVTRSSRALQWAVSPSFHELLKLLQFFSGNGVKFAVMLLLWCFGAWRLWRLASRSDEQMSRWRVWFVALWITVPVTLVFLMSIRRPMLVDRYLLICLPPLLLLAAAGVDQLPRRAGQLVVGILVAACLITDYSGYRKQPEDWRGLYAYIAQSSKAGDAVAFLPTFTRLGFDYYKERAGAAGPQVLGVAAYGSEPDLRTRIQANPREMLTECHPCSRIWVVDYAPDSPRGDIREWRDNFLTALHGKYSLEENKEFPNARLLLYRRNPASPVIPRSTCR